MQEPFEIRSARATDLTALTAIYNHYVVHTHAVFDERAATDVERRAWFERYADSGPHRLLIAEQAGEVCGWASSQEYRSHPAFRECVETSVMLAPHALRRGLGSALYRRLFELLANEPVHRAYAGVALPNPASCRLHEKLGFRAIGTYSEYALKHGQRISSVWYEKPF